MYVCCIGALWLLFLVGTLSETSETPKQAKQAKQAKHRNSETAKQRKSESEHTLLRSSRFALLFSSLLAASHVLRVLVCARVCLCLWASNEAVACVLVSLMAPVATAPSTTSPTPSSVVSSVGTAKSVHALPRISWQELAKHNSRSDCWFAVRGVVYNVTDWIDRHPGGADVLVLNAGRDATTLFECYHPFGKSHELLRKYAVATLIDTELPTFPPMSRFYLTLKRRVYDHLASKGLSTKSAPLTVAVGFAYVFGLFASYAAGIMALEHASTLAGLAAASLQALGVLLILVAGWCSAMVCLVPTHEGSHVALTHRPWMWRLLGATLDFSNGCSLYSWLHQHFLGHHPYTNLGDVDPDVHTNEPDVRRIKASQTESTRYRWQYLYVPVLYGLLAAKFRINDLQMYFSLHSNGRIRMNDPEPFHVALFYFGKVWLFFYRFVLPPLLLGLQSVPRVVFAALLLDLVASYYLSIAFQVNHVVSNAQWPVVRPAPADDAPLPPNATDTDFSALSTAAADTADAPTLPSVRTRSAYVDMDWAVMQIVTTIDYAHGSWWTTKLTGALNHQAVHHLLPEISQAHYMEIAPVVRQTCAEFNVPYVVLPTFWDAFKAHINHLRTLGLVKLH